MSSGEVGYDNAHEAPLADIGQAVAEAAPVAVPVDGMGCHSGTTMEAAARAAASAAA